MKKIKLIFMAIVVIFFAYYLIGDNLKSKWGMIDDHAIISILGPELKVNYSKLPHIIYSNIVGTYGTFIRQVPTYLVLRTFEAFFWGNNPFLWYLFRFVLLVLTFFISLYILEKTIGIVYGFIFLAYIMTGEYWSGILTRLGTHESYVMPGMAIYFLGFFNILNNKSDEKSKNIFNWFLIFIGTIIAAGSKENLVILLMPSTFIFWFELKNKKINFTKILIYLLSAVFCIFISIGILIVLKKTGHDVYANNISPTYRIMLFVRGFVNAIKISGFIYFLTIFLAINIISFFKLPKISFKHFLKTGVKFLLIIISLFIFYASQYAFYNGQWPTGMRYDFPGLLSMPFYFLVVYLYALDFLKHAKINKIFIFIISFLFFSIILFLTLSKGYGILRGASLQNAKETIVFSNKINKLVIFSKKHKDYPIIYDSFNVFDYESIASVSTFLKNYGVINNKFLIVNEYSMTVNPAIAKILAEQLNDISINGSFNSPWDITSVKKMQILENNKCISIGFLRKSNFRCIYTEIIP